MMETLIIADDFTGALDTGVKFSVVGVSTRVVTDWDTELSFDAGETVLVLCAPTRHLPPQEAYRIIRGITERAVRAGVGCIFKKTDSALRGNVGAELSAVLDGSGEAALCFIPALPAMGRVTRQGIQYIDGVPVRQSVFGQDPFEPVTESSVSALLHLQCDVPVEIVPAGAFPDFDEYGNKQRIYVFDCVSDADMHREVQGLRSRGRLKLLAGCSGLAETLASFSAAGQAEETVQPAANRMIVLCGSVNPVSLEQMEYAERNGYQRFHIPEEQLLSRESLRTGKGRELIDRLWAASCRNSYLMIDALPNDDSSLLTLRSADRFSAEELRQQISRRLGAILKELLDRGAHSRLMIVGGDTLLSFLEAIHCREMYPIREITPGIVLSHIPYRNRIYEVITKSGGFGGEDILVALGAQLEDENNGPIVSPCSASAF